jgi:hypothetical protein
MSKTSVSIFYDRSDPVADGAPVRWALGELEEVLKDRHVAYRILERFALDTEAAIHLLIGGPSSQPSREILDEAGVAVPNAPESLGLVRETRRGQLYLVVVGSDARGLVYALLELADRLTYAEEPLEALQQTETIIETPANAIRSVNRLFTSEVEDKPWFYDKGFWSRYLTMLVSQRFNRLHLALGMGYDGPNHVVTDSYFHFAYPFLVAVPGYDTRVEGLSEGEREQNLAMLCWISEQAALRGLHFHLGLWTHNHEFHNSPEVSHPVVGLSADRLAPYCRDALRTLLQACPAIAGITFRAHYESGIPEGTYDFWGTVFDGVAEFGRRVELDLHAKGIDHEIIASALATGQPVNVSTKFWAEHMGLPYHQANIRELEQSVHEGEHLTADPLRRFTRYGYGDYLKEDRAYGVFYRLWPGSQRLLLWGDPTTAAQYSRASGFCGGLGMELCEPLSFKGRQGSGLRQGRQLYVDTSLRLPDGEWQKYLYTYRLWGRLLYDPDSAPETWQRYLRRNFAAAAPALEAALAQASRILPLVTTAHLPSAANNHNWPEIYTNMPIVNEDVPHPYSDTPKPKRLGAVSPLDPELFSSIDAFAEAFVQGRKGAKYTPLEVAQWLDGLAAEAERHLEAAQAQISAKADPAFRRMAIDIAVQIRLGRFFAHKLRAGVAYALYERKREASFLQDALVYYHCARDVWAEIVKLTVDVYLADLTFGPQAYKRGHWADRLASLDHDLLDMENEWYEATGTDSFEKKPVHDYRSLGARSNLRPQCEHIPPDAVQAGLPLAIEVIVQGAGTSPTKVLLHYRRVNQAETFSVQEMQRDDRRYQAVIPGEYTKSPYPLMYFFELGNDDGDAWLYPGLNPDLSNQPYLVVRQRSTVK